ncbi:MAG: DUF2202 domain-containing protein [Nanoarchaeota archaeon]|nr:DUF2202 domain-containing protein [Nanoarchaeota archaeon]
MKKITILFSILLLGLLVGCSTNQKEITSNSQVKFQEPSSLSQGEIDALYLALSDEYKAEATYLQVIEDFGEVKPFTNIMAAEQKHAEKLIVLLEKYDLDIPQNTYIGTIESYDSVQEACSVGVKAEIENVELYDQLLSSTEREDILRVYRALQRASQENHLPAFENCS